MYNAFMKILIIGSGGREHALAWKCAQAEKVEKVFVSPGNGGTAVEAKCENVLQEVDPASAAGQEQLLQFAKKEKIDLAVAGPELPLVEGIVDRFRAGGVGIIGPDKKAARLEASKMYSKQFMEQYGVRTARSRHFTGVDAAIAYAGKHFNAVKDHPVPLVIKADGLAGGKGVVIAENGKEAETALLDFMRHKSLGEAGNSVLLEEFLEGKEVSVLAAVSVKNGGGYILPFIGARDHKRRFEGGTGPNTGGMGAIAPVPDFSPAAHNDFIRAILEPTLTGMKAETFDYRGFIFFGLMICNSRRYLLEYNVRLGDPETQAVLPLMNCNFVDLCQAILDGRDFSPGWKQGAVCAPVAVAEGYPGAYRKGDLINIDESALATTGAKIFTGGARETEGDSGGAPVSLITSGGRVMTVSAWGADADEAWTNAYRALETISFSGMGFRKDIGRE